MNRRELTKNGFLSLFAALLGKKVEEPEVELSYTVAWCTGGPTAWDSICGKWGDTGNGPCPEDEGCSLSG